MNIIFGTCGAEDAADRASAACDAVGRAYGGAVEIALEIPGHTAGIHSDGGAVLGQAEEAGVSLAYIGVILPDLPGWSDPGSPLDDPDATARHLLGRYRSEGPRFLDGVAGSYAVVVSDPAESRVMIGVDPANGHSLFLRRHQGGFAYATKLGAMPLICPDLTLDRGLEDFLLGYQFLPGGRTVYAGVEALEKGTLLDWRSGSLTEHRIEPPSFAELPDLAEATLDEVVGVLHEEFMQALEAVAPRASRVAVMLGGFDSALVASGLRRLGKEVDTFSFAFEADIHNQPHTDTLERFAGTRHHWVLITADTIANGLAGYERMFNLTAVQPHYPIESVEVARRIREAGLLHAVTGDGCDGLFLGYPTIHRRARLVDRLTKMPRAIRGMLRALAGSRWLEYRLGHPYRVARNLLDVLGRDPLTRGHFGSRAIDGRSLVLAGRPGIAQERDVEDVLRELAAQTTGMSALRRAFHSKALSGSNKNKMEGCIDGTGVAVTSPFMHPRFAQVAARLPDELSRREGTDRGLGKYALTRMTEQFKLLPPEIIYQPKRSPAEAPVDGWYAGDLRPRVEELLGHLPFEIDQGYVDALLAPKLAERLYRRKVSLDTVATHALMALATYAAFARPLTKDRA